MCGNINEIVDIRNLTTNSNVLPCNKVMPYLNICKILTVIIIIVFSFDPFGYSYLLFNEF